VCQIAFLQKCDKDQSRSVSKAEWLKCFQINPGDHMSLKSVTIIKDSILCSLYFISRVGNNILVIINFFSVCCFFCCCFRVQQKLFPWPT